MSARARACARSRQYECLFAQAFAWMRVYVCVYISVHMCSCIVACLFTLLVHIRARQPMCVSASNSESMSIDIPPYKIVGAFARPISNLKHFKSAQISLATIWPMPYIFNFLKEAEKKED